MASNIFTRMLLAARAGMQFAGRRNLYEVFGYPRKLRASDLIAKYQRQDITSRIVNMPPEEMWRFVPEISGVRGLDTKWKDFVAHTELYDRIVQADKLCYFGPFSALVLGLRGNPTQPAPQIAKASDVLYLQAYGGDTVGVKKYEEDTLNPRFGMPLTYEVQVGPGNPEVANISSTTKEFHWTRVIHIVDRPLQGKMFSEPRLNQIYNLLDDLLKVGGGSAELFWITANRGMQVDVDKDMELDPEDAKQLTEELDEFQHNLRRYVRTRGVKIENLGSDPVDPRGVFEVLMSLLAGATSIPQRILMGSEAGQLASEQDRANWAEYMDRRRSTFGVPYVLRPIIRHLGTLGYVPENAWEKATFEWPEAFPMNPLEEANALASRARAVVNFSRRNQFDDPVISDEEARVMLRLPEEVPEGHTMPKAPEKKTGTGIQSVPGGASDAPNQVTQNPSEPAGNAERPSRSTSTTSAAH